MARTTTLKNYYPNEEEIRRLEVLRKALSQKTISGTLRLLINLNYEVSMDYSINHKK